MSTNAQNPTLDQLRSKAATTLSDVKHDVGSAANQMRGAAGEATEAVKADLHQLMEMAKTSGKAEFAAIAERLSGYVGAIAESATALQQKGREKVNQVAETTDTYVHDQPWQSVAIGAGVGAAVGFALGFLSARR